MKTSSRYHQENQDLKEIACLEEYSFSDVAAKKINQQYYEGKLSLEYHANIAKVFDSIRENTAGIIPIENSNGGIVWPHLDKLIKNNIRIVQELNLPIEMCVGSISSNVQEITSVVSHPKALEQCSKFIDNLEEDEAGRGLKRVPMNSTVAACNGVITLNDPSALVLASREAIQASNLHLYETDIANSSSDSNITQFYLTQALHSTEKYVPNAEDEKFALDIIPKNKRGVLADILKESLLNSNI
jgi:chorismate mutase / prephenate dehydratase